MATENVRMAQELDEYRTEEKKLMESLEAELTRSREMMQDFEQRRKKEQPVGGGAGGVFAALKGVPEKEIDLKTL